MNQETFRISDLRNASNALDGARNWKQGGTTAENLHTDLAHLMQGRIRRIWELIAITPARFSKDIENAKQSIGWAEAAMLRNALGRRTLWEILGTTQIPAGQYPEAKRVDIFAIRQMVDCLDGETITAVLAKLETSENYTISEAWILPDLEAKPANCPMFAVAQ